MGCGVYWQQIKRLDESLGMMRMRGISPSAGPYQELFRLRGKIMGKVGVKYPREITLLMRVLGLSPGEVKLWHDAESGFMSEARAYSGAPPVYKAVSDDVAIAILNKEITKELEAELMTPDEYLGE